jgi:hypothetical protein
MPATQGIFYLERSSEAGAAEDKNSQRLHLFLSERILNAHSGGCDNREFDKLATGSGTHFY